jgi:purine-cytosine permease-like protein
VSFADRWAVPTLFVTGIVLTIACLRTPLPAGPAASGLARDWWRGLDIVFGYQVSWLLMFGDYPRYVRSPQRAAIAVFGGLALAALWFMPLGFLAATIARSNDPGVMVFALGLGWWGAILITLATVAANFVNIYMSALALKSMRPATGDQFAIWLIGGVGAALSLVSWLQRFGDLMQIIAGTFIPVGGILLAHYFILRRPVVVDDLYDANGPYARHRGWAIPGTAAWIAGAGVYLLIYSLSKSGGGTGPSFAASVGVYLIVSRVVRQLGN